MTQETTIMSPTLRLDEAREGCITQFALRSSVLVPHSDFVVK